MAVGAYNYAISVPEILNEIAKSRVSGAISPKTVRHHLRDLYVEEAVCKARLIQWGLAHVRGHAPPQIVPRSLEEDALDILRASHPRGLPLK